MPRIRLPLSEAASKTILEVAHQRNAKEARFGAMTYGGKRKSEEAHIIGVASELALAEYCNVEIDYTIYEKGDSGIDLVIPTYGCVSVKSTTYWKKPLLRAEVEHDSPKIDTYICCYVDKSDFSNVWLIGWATRSEVITFPARRLFDGGPLNYILEETQLHEPVI